MRAYIYRYGYPDRNVEFPRFDYALWTITYSVV